MTYKQNYLLVFYQFMSYFGQISQVAYYYMQVPDFWPPLDR